MTNAAILKFKKKNKKTTPVTPVAAEVDNEAGATETDVGNQDNLSYNNPVVKFSVDSDPNAVEDV